MRSKLIKVVRKNDKLIDLLVSTPPGNQRINKILNLIGPCLKKKDKIIDIGSGPCIMAKRLLENGHSLTPVDVKDLSFYKDIEPIIYNGKKLPFKNDSFDVALLIAVLHHTPDPIKIIKEAKRVAKRIIIVEDVYENTFQKLLTFGVDSLINLEFFGHPHSNKNDEEWLKVFKDLNLKLLYRKKYRLNKVFLFCAYHLQKYTNK